MMSAMLVRLLVHEGDKLLQIASNGRPGMIAERVARWEDLKKRALDILE